ncbi:MAG: transposase, partial [Granulosicoccus sp.]
MSLSSRILGLPGLEVERVDWNQGIDIWAKPIKRPSCLYCGCNHLRIKATYKRTVKHSRQGNRVITLHLKAPKYHCQQCTRYFCHRFTGIRPRFRASEGYRLEVFEAHDGGVTQRKLSLTHRISPATVERWYRHHTDRKLYECTNRSCPRVLGIDEHFFTRKKGFATTCVDLEKHHVLDVKLGRSESSLRSYLSALPNRNNVEVMVMDLSETYRSIAKSYFPNATIVADRFHVVRLVIVTFSRPGNRTILTEEKTAVAEPHAST